MIILFLSIAYLWVKILQYIKNKTIDKTIFLVIILKIIL